MKKITVKSQKPLIQINQIGPTLKIVCDSLAHHPIWLP